MRTSLVISYEGFQYYIIFLDHFTKYIYFFPIKQKSGTKEVFIKFKALVENYFQSKIKIFYPDNSGEYTVLASFLALSRDTHYMTLPHTPKHNWYSECYHQHIVETGLTLMSFRFTKRFVDFFFQNRNLFNRMPTPIIPNSSPFSSFFNTT